MHHMLTTYLQTVLTYTLLKWHHPKHIYSKIFKVQMTWTASTGNARLLIIPLWTKGATWWIIKTSATEVHPQNEALNVELNLIFTVSYLSQHKKMWPYMLYFTWFHKIKFVLGNNVHEGGIGGLSLIFSVKLTGLIIVCETMLNPTAMSVLQIKAQILMVPRKPPRLINNSTMQQRKTWVIRTKGSRTSYSKDHF